MADNNDILKAIESIKKDMATKQDIQRVEQNQAQTNNSLAHITTAVEAIAAGQKELQETVATKADMQDLKATLTKKVNDHEERIEELEKNAGLPHPHKH